MKMTAFPNRQVLDLALSFHDAAEVLHDADANAIPIINLRCHAIELFLKSLHLKDTATDVGEGVSLLRPVTGRGISHSLTDSFGNALQEHRDELVLGMPSLSEDLASLEGVFQKSRYVYENGDRLPLSTAERVSRYLAEKLPELTRLAVSND